MPVTHGGVVVAVVVVMAVEAEEWKVWGWVVAAGAAQCTGLLGAIGSRVIDRGGQQLRQSHW